MNISLQSLAVLVVLGIVAYLIDTYIAMSPPFHTVFRIICVLVLCAWLLGLVGYPIVHLH